MEADAALVEAARLGDRAAYALLAERHRPLVVGLCRRMLADPGLAEDAAQEAILTGLLELDRLRDPRRVGAWLAGIGLNVCRRWLRRRRLPETPPPGDAGDPAEAAEAAELAERVRRAVAALPPGQRRAVTAFYLRGLSHAEVAGELGIAIGAVKTRLHKARAALRAPLADLREEPVMAEELVAMRVADVHRVATPEGEVPRHVVVLAERDGPRRLPIWIGPAEAVPLAIALLAVETPRPLTYALTAALVEAVGGRLRRCRVSRLTEGTFYAEVLVEGPGGVTVVDARPSDALNLALTTGADIVVDARVLEATAGAELPDGPGAEDWLTSLQSYRVSGSPPSPSA